MPGGVALDVGAYIGTHTMLMGRLIGDGRVHAFEPQSRTFEELRVNIAINGLQDIVVPWRLALSDAPATLTMNAAAGMAARWSPRIQSRCSESSSGRSAGGCGRSNGAGGCGRFFGSRKARRFAAELDGQALRNLIMALAAVAHIAPKAAPQRFRRRL